MQTVGTSGDNDYDEAAARKYPFQGAGGIWTPPVWSGGPLAMIAHARSQNGEGYASAFAAAGAHSNPPNNPWQRDFL
jgi:hypothetical protein